MHGTCYSHILFSAMWFKQHPMADSYGSPISIWECDIFDIPEVSYIIPIQFIRCRTVSLVDKLNDTYGTVLFVSPCVDGYVVLCLQLFYAIIIELHALGG